MEDADQFFAVCRENDFHIEEAKAILLRKYVDALREWNEKVNLVSRQDISNIWMKHILPSISFLFSFAIDTPAKILDLGTGGGLPGIPISILVPGVKVTLLDSIQKKINAVRNIVSQAGLQNVDAVCDRAESLPKAIKQQSSYDYVISRGVAPIVDLLKWSRPLLAKPSNASGGKNLGTKTPLAKGSVLMLKGGDLSAETEVAQKRYPQANIQAHPLVIRGNHTLEGKLLVVAQL
ncbi:MAG TPA: 16S rRNA (guanine(527)-N(7))-methyltransferase RsmG [Bacteroidota bacterium]|jgi:16S rRNA (guanine527-N7)-methyltransferase|nr:16S rRNA (guanine(527)-N(7))-methyltransferase RsmG [Bacteroidota bacterium]